MPEWLTWLAGNGEKLTVITILAVALLALVRGWIVTGTAYTDLKKDRDEWVEKYRYLSEQTSRVAERSATLAEVVSLLRRQE